MSTQPTYLDLPATDLFRDEQVIMQLTPDGLAIDRVVIHVGDSWVAVASPQMPTLGVRYFGAIPGALGSLADLLPPNVGRPNKRPAPKTGRDLMRSLGLVIMSQRLRDATAHVPGDLDAPAVGGYVQIPQELPSGYVVDLLNAYLPYEQLDVELQPRWSSLNDRIGAEMEATRRLIGVKVRRS